ncbi:succinyl-diaminopimelate desuccinylase [Oryzibacter oryziterrae]|uniref:succinyl-diaminopimelate desuccinylase n=1 Tax=Oryzibacter oryziterrae TaxID=2766474 RepID=UPI001F02C9EA|nr:succinyl-diaminopimelate desuccinylase [Oryzibacter oryziterrae]
MPHDPVSIARDLLMCPSVTPEEGGALAFIEGLLKPAGFAVDRPVFTEDGTPDIENLFAGLGAGNRHLCFAGHTDVVPPGPLDKWSHGPFAGDIVDGLLYGRGAVDMKGGIAAFAAAALDFIADKGPSFGGRISFLITGDEEGPSINGTVKLLEWAVARGERFSHCIVGEPTNPNALGDMVKVGRRGSLSGLVTVKGTQGHVAYPHLADNPLRVAPSVMAALMDPPLDAGNERFQPSNLEVTSVETGNRATNVIPAEVRLAFNVRFNDIWTVETLEAEIAARVKRGVEASTLREGRDKPMAYALAFEPTNAVSFLTHDAMLIGGLADAVEAVTGKRPELSTTGGTSDARFIKNYCPVVEFGLVGQTMHKIDECVAVEDLQRLKVIYRTFLDRYFAD